jgi:hypothetical protein
MELNKLWRPMFERWPQDLPRRGVVTTTLEEQYPFKGYMVSGDLVLLERTNPDPLGTRFMFLPYAQIAAVKIVDVVQEKTFASMGYEGKLSGK